MGHMTSTAFTLTQSTGFQSDTDKLSVVLPVGNPVGNPNGNPIGN